MIVYVLRSFLRDLIEANHIFLRMLEQYSKNHTHLVVQKKKRRGGHRKKKNPAAHGRIP